MNTLYNLSIYVLTYNTPKQFDLWCKSFLEAHENTFNKCKKYVINNSDDPSLKREYQNLFSNYSFKEIHSSQNIGINDGRLLAAKHFHYEKNKYMIFFEDDMLLQSSERKLCRSGFSTYCDNLFEKSISILQKENLDYLKINFTEVYSENHDNVIWHTLNIEGKNDSFTGLSKNKDAYSSKVRIKYTGSRHGLPFAVGNYYYCNWPILFTKNANRIFFEKKFESNRESIWMIVSYLLNDFEFLKSGCLFLSPINHFRKYSYGKENRKENAQGDNII